MKTTDLFSAHHDIRCSNRTGYFVRALEAYANDDDDAGDMYMEEYITFNRPHV